MTDSTSETISARAPEQTRRPRRLSRAEKPRPENCLNCGHPTVGNFCPDCGQDNRSYEVSLWELLKDAWDEFMRVDSRFFRTLIPLLFRPGFLTREYMAGRRARYIAPFKLYLVVSFLFFLAVSYHTSPPDFTGTKAPKPAIVSDGKDRPDIIHVGRTRIDLNKLPRTVEEYRAAQEALPAAQRDNRTARILTEATIHLKARSADDIMSGIFSALSKMMFFMLPLFAMLLKLLYIRSRRMYIEHFVFALHIHSAFFVLFILPNLIPLGFLGVLVALAVPVYGFIALRVAYQQDYAKTFVKGVFLAFNYFILLAIATVITLLVSLALQADILASVRALL